MKSADCSISIISRATCHGSSPAIVFEDHVLSYSQILDQSARIASGLLNGADDLNGSRVAFLVEKPSYTSVQWGIWRAGGIAVPLCDVHPMPELDYVIEDSDANVLIAEGIFIERLEPIARHRALPLMRLPDLLSSSIGPLPQVGPQRPAMILYTSGTTGKPKGAVTTHSQIEAQITTLIEAWEWTSDDHILHVLPLHHVHGIINILCCALWAGARCETLPRFDADQVWDLFIKRKFTLFMAVPTIYVRLITAWEKAPASRRKQMSEACKSFRLMVSGSAALPVSVLEKWREITGHTLLERYGMTEIGMALSNPLHGKRVPGAVGVPLPGVEVRVVDEAGVPVPEGEEGELQVRGPGVFSGYWRRPQESKESFRDGWFCTGDVAVVDGGVYRVLGRKSIDIIKTGGYKVSALEIEEVFRAHPDIADCAVVGVEDPQWGERVCIGIVPKPGKSLTMDYLRDWGKQRLAPYKVPSRMLILEELPRNPLGKVTKREVKSLFLKSSVPAE